MRDRSRRASRRTLVAALAAAGAVAAWTAPSASAAPASIEAGTGGANVFSAGTFAHDAGTVANLVIASGSHNVTAAATGPDGKPLFRSATVSSGPVPVDGSQYVPQGVYPFVCTVHPGMSSSLNVNAGTPLPRPEVRLRVKSGSLDEVVRKKAVKVKANVLLGQGETAEVNVKLGKRTIGIPQETISNNLLRIRLTGKGRALLEERNKATIRAEATVEFGSPASAKRKLR
jgi:plastocyanin